MKIDELEVYQRAMRIGEEVWKLVDNWSSFAKMNVGSQFVRSVDSIAANISEGYGRYHYKENTRFCYIGRGSLTESYTWLTKAFSRELINEDTYDRLKQELNTIGRMLNGYIKSIGKGIVKEDTATYLTEEPLFPPNDQCPMTNDQ